MIKIIGSGFKSKIISHIKIQQISEKNADNVIDLINKIYGAHYFEEEFYEKDVIEHYIEKTYDKKGGVWKGIFFKGELIGQMLAIIEKCRMVLKLTMLKKEYRKSGMMLMLSASMIKEIKNYNQNDFRSIFAFVDSHNTPIIKILKRFKFREVGTIPSRGHEKILIYCLVPFNNKLLVISHHPRLAKNIKESVEKLDLKRTLLPDRNLFRSDANKDNPKIIIKKKLNNYPVKYHVSVDNKKIASFLENRQKNFLVRFCLC